MKRERAQELMKLTPEMHELLKQAFKAMDSSAQRGHRISGQHACPTCMLQHDSSTRLCVFWLGCADGDGEIDIEEFMQRAKSLTEGDREKAAALFELFDQRGSVHRRGRKDGKLSSDEWCAALKPVHSVLMQALLAGTPPLAPAR